MVAWEKPKFLQIAKKVNDSLYYIFDNKKMKDTVIRQVTGISNGIYNIRQFDRNGNIEFDCQSLSIFPLQFNGQTILYDKDESPMTEVAYIRGKKIKEVFLFNPVDSQVVITSKAEFPGGENEFVKTIAKNAKYPMMEINKGTGGNAYVKFKIDEEGKMEDVQAAHIYEDALTRSLIRAIEEIDKRWIPAKCGDRMIAVWYYASLSFAPPVTIVGH